MTAPTYETDRFLPASFRGVVFDVISHTREGGLRGGDFEYPQRNVGSVENQGKKLEKFVFDAFTIGDVHHRQARDLLAALVVGRGELVHPRYGPQQVICRAYSANEVLSEGGRTRFSLSFVEAGEEEGLEAFIIDSVAVENASTNLVNEAINSLVDTLDLVRFPQIVGDTIAAIQAGRDRVVSAVQNPRAGPISDPAGFFALTGQALDSTGLTIEEFLRSIGQRFVDLVAFIDDIAALTVLAESRPTPLDPDATPNPDPIEQQRLSNVAGVDAALHRIALARLAAIAADFDFATFDDAIAASETIGAFFEDEENSVASFDEFEALRATRIELTIALANKAESLVRLRDFAVEHLTSCVAMAWDLYGDANRADEIADRNGIAHPAFVPPGTYRVLAE